MSLSTALKNKPEIILIGTVNILTGSHIFMLCSSKMMKGQNQEGLKKKLQGLCFLFHAAYILTLQAPLQPLKRNSERKHNKLNLQCTKILQIYMGLITKQNEACITQVASLTRDKSCISCYKHCTLSSHVQSSSSVRL